MAINRSGWNRHGDAAFDFATVYGSDQLVVGPAHARGGTHGILMINVLDLVRIAINCSTDR